MSQTDSPAAWFRLAIALVVAVIGNAGMWAIIVILPAIETEFATDRAGASLPYTLTMMGYALGNFAIGRAVDRFGITISLIGAALCITAGFLLASVAPSLAVLTAVQFAIGFGNAVAFGPLMADISHWFERRRGIAVAIVASGNYLSGAIWPMILAGVLAQSGWRAVYLVLAVVTLAGIIPLSLLLRRRIDHAAAARSAVRPVASTGLSNNALVGLLALAGVGCCVAMSMPQVHIVAYCTDLGYGSETGSRMLSLMLAGGVVSRIASGFIADRLGGLRTILIGSALQALALAAYLPSGGLASLYTVSLIFGLSQGGIVPSYALVVRETLPARTAGSQVGFVLMATVFGMALGGWLTGVIRDMSGSYELAFINGIAWNVLNFAIIATIWLRSRPARLAAA